MEITHAKLKGLRSAQPRQRIDQAKKAALMESIRAIGLQVPIILYETLQGLTIVDGHLRVDCLLELGETEADAIVLKSPPTDAELLIIQLSIDVHRQSLTAFERADLLQGGMDRLKCGVTELAQKTGMKQPLVSKLLPLAGLSQAIRDILQNVDQEKCYYVAISSPEKQLELAMQAAGLTRDQLHATARGLEPKSKSAVFPINGFTVTLRGRSFLLKDAVSVFQCVIRELRNAERDSVSLATLCQILADKAKVQP